MRVSCEIGRNVYGQYSNMKSRFSCDNYLRGFYVTKWRRNHFIVVDRKRTFIDTYG